MEEMNEETNQEKLLCPKAGTATSSPCDELSSQSDKPTENIEKINITNVLLWIMKKSLRTNNY